MSTEELIDRILEMQDMLREGLAVRDSLHYVLNQVLAANEEQVVEYADLEDEGLSPEEHERKRAWAAARLAVANPSRVVKRLHGREHQDD